MVSGVLAAIAAVLGIAIGRFWDTRSEDRRYTRDKRIECYERQAALFFKMREAIRAIGTCEPESTESTDALCAALEVGSEWNGALASVWLHSSAEVTQSLSDVDLGLNAALLKAVDGKYSWDEWRVERQPVEEVMERFLASVRTELRRPELPVRLRTFSLESLQDRARRSQIAGAGDTLVGE